MLKVYKGTMVEKHGTRHRDSEEDGVVLCACCPPGLQLGLCAPPRPASLLRWPRQAWPKLGKGPFRGERGH